MTLRLPIAAICGDPGGAAAIAPVLARLCSLDGYELAAFAYRQAVAVLARHGIQAQALDEALDCAAVEEIFRQHRPRFLLTATSCNGRDLEKLFIELANRTGVPSLAVLDFWSNYRARFADGCGALRYLPRLIAVMDEQAYAEMIAAGFSAGLLQVTGHPGFDALAARRSGFAQHELLGVRLSLGIAPQEILVTFASQPIAELYGEDASHPRFIGYQERTTLALLVAALEHASTLLAQPVALLIRPHPRERAEWMRALQSARIRILVHADGDASSVVLSTDLVVGMSSILLVEAALLGCPVVSLQPNLAIQNPLPHAIQAAVPTVVDPGKIPAIIAGELMIASNRALTRLQRDCLPQVWMQGATERVLSCIQSLLGASAAS